MERSHSSWKKKELFLLRKVKVLQNVQWSGLCMVTAGETVTLGGQSFKAESWKPLICGSLLGMLGF